METMNRAAGVLCHISSLPNEYGIGSMGREAYAFVDVLKASGVKYWQILPLQQTGFGDSPYQSVSCSSGNPYFIDIVALRDRGLIDDTELNGARKPLGGVDYSALYVERYALLRKAFSRFDVTDAQFRAFADSGEADDYALFMSLKTRYPQDFSRFPAEYKFRDPQAVDALRQGICRGEYLFWVWLQYEFKAQWSRLKAYANGKGVKIIGDIPLYVAYDSADVWSHPDLFQLDGQLKPTKVAGVPPDYFSKTGQLWGNPLYDWRKMRADGYQWWVRRIAKARELYDVVRIDHFRGLDRYYAIPADAETAMVGEWEQGPALSLFREIERQLGKVDIIAEDLGIIDDGVVALREATGFPGMKIMMFAFDGNADNDYLPCHIKENSVTYTGTHDNDTALGFLDKLTDGEFLHLKKQLRAALRSEGVYMPVVTRSDAAKAFVLCALNTKSKLVVVPIQDVLGLDNSARMNEPSTSGINWKFRLKGLPDGQKMAELKKMIQNSGR